MGVEKMQQARYQRRALIIISDGGANRSHYTEHDVKSRIKEADVLVYSIGIFDTTFQSMEEDIGPGLLSDISNVTGATSYTLDSPNDLPQIAGRIGAELRTQYLLGFRPGDSQRDGKWRKIEVTCTLPEVCIFTCRRGLATTGLAVISDLSTLVYGDCQREQFRADMLLANRVQAIPVAILQSEGCRHLGRVGSSPPSFRWHAHDYS